MCGRAGRCMYLCDLTLDQPFVRSCGKVCILKCPDLRSAFCAIVQEGVGVYLCVLCLCVYLYVFCTFA